MLLLKHSPFKANFHIKSSVEKENGNIVKNCVENLEDEVGLDRPPWGFRTSVTTLRSLHQLTTWTPGSGVYVRDCRGRQYLDLVAGRGTLNTGHNHPHIVRVLAQGTPSRSYLDEFKTLATQLFKYNTVVPLSSGVEAYKLVLKAASKWGFKSRGVPEKKAVVLVSPGTHLELVGGFCFQQPPLFKYLLSNNVSCLEAMINSDPDVVGYMMEVVNWGSGGPEVASRRELEEVRRLCTRHGLLWVVDETFTGLGRTGHLMGYMHDRSQPDMVVMSNNLGAGLHPVSMVMGTDMVFELLGANLVNDVRCSKLGLRVALETLKVVSGEGLTQNSLHMGMHLRSTLGHNLHPEEIPQIKGRGLLVALRIHGGIGEAWEICELMKRKGVLAWPCSSHYVGFTPPLVITEVEVDTAVHVLASVIDSLLQKHMENGHHSFLT